LVLPTQQHSLRGMIEDYIRVGSIAIERLLEIDGLYGALEFVHKSDWSAILPVTTVIGDIASSKFVVNPIIEPATKVEYYLIHQTQRPLLHASRKLVGQLEDALKRSATEWSDWQDGTAGSAKQRAAAE
jgi:DNA-binding transcriptional LysR family regulator